MPHPTIREIDEALYGSHWQSELARALNMSDRHMRRLAFDDGELADGTLADIGKLARDRAKEIEHIIKQL